MVVVVVVFESLETNHFLTFLALNVPQ